MGFFQKLFGGTDQINLKQMIADGAFLVDVRTNIEFVEGHAKGSTNIPLDNIQANITTFKNKKNIVLFCRTGIRASQAKAILAKNGIEQVVNAKTWVNISRLIA